MVYIMEKFTLLEVMDNYFIYDFDSYIIYTGAVLLRALWIFGPIT